MKFHSKDLPLDLVRDVLKLVEDDLVRNIAQTNKHISDLTLEQANKVLPYIRKMHQEAQKGVMPYFTLYFSQVEFFSIESGPTFVMTDMVAYKVESLVMIYEDRGEQ